MGQLGTLHRQEMALAVIWVVFSFVKSSSMCQSNTYVQGQCVQCDTLCDAIIYGNHGCFHYCLEILLYLNPDPPCKSHKYIEKECVPCPLLCTKTMSSENPCYEECLNSDPAEALKFIRRGPACLSEMKVDGKCIACSVLCGSKYDKMGHPCHHYCLAANPLRSRKIYHSWIPCKSQTYIGGQCLSCSMMCKAVIDREHGCYDYCLDVIPLDAYKLINPCESGVVIDGICVPCPEMCEAELKVTDRCYAFCLEYDSYDWDFFMPNEEDYPESHPVIPVETPAPSLKPEPVFQSVLIPAALIVGIISCYCGRRLQRCYAWVVNRLLARM